MDINSFIIHRNINSKKKQPPVEIILITVILLLQILKLQLTLQRFLTE